MSHDVSMNCRIVLLFLGFSLLLTASGAAQVEPSPSPPPAANLSTGIPFDAAAATQAWLDTVPADKRAKSDAYFEGGYWLILWNFLMTAAIAIFLLQSRLATRSRHALEELTRFKALQVGLFGLGSWSSVMRSLFL